MNLPEDIVNQFILLTKPEEGSVYSSEWLVADVFSVAKIQVLGLNLSTGRKVEDAERL
jgi:hypothetical protein